MLRKLQFYIYECCMFFLHYSLTNSQICRRTNKWAWYLVSAGSNMFLFNLNNIFCDKII